MGHRWGWVMVAAVLGAVGCTQSADDAGVAGPSDGNETVDEEPAASDDPVVAFLATEVFTAGDDPNGIHYDESGGLCMAERVMALLGRPRLEELGLDVAAGLTPRVEEPPLTVAEADQVYAAMGECVDVTAQLTDVLVRGDLSQDDAECVAEEFVASGMPRRTVLASQATQPAADDVNGALADAGEACGVAGVGLLPPG
jgi:hypothetical protein